MRYNTDIMKSVRFSNGNTSRIYSFQFTKMTTSLCQLTEKEMYFELNILYISVEKFH